MLTTIEQGIGGNAERLKSNVAKGVSAVDGGYSVIRGRNSHVEDDAKLAGTKFKPAIESPYRWRNWAAKSDGVIGDELLAFINNEETTRLEGKPGAGLFRYLPWKP